MESMPSLEKRMEMQKDVVAVIKELEPQQQYRLLRAIIILLGLDRFEQNIQ